MKPIFGTILAGTIAVVAAQSEHSNQTSRSGPQPEPADPFSSDAHATPAKAANTFADGENDHGDPFGAVPPPVVIPRIEMGDSSLGDLLGLASDFLNQNGKPIPNFVYKDGTENLKLPPLRLRNVSVRSLMEVVESLVDVDVDVLDNRGGEEIIVIKSSRRPMPSVRTVYGQSGRPGPPIPGGRAAPQSRQETRVFATANLGVKDEDLESTIRAVWDFSDPEWNKGSSPAKLLFHPGTRILVVKAKPERLQEVEQVLDQLAESLRKSEESTVYQLRQRMDAVASRAEEVEVDRARLLEKLRELELELHKARAGHAE
ncbi:MAG: hypothetical protein AAGB14_05165 [Verrucomicrobiota bacterium]